MKPYTVLVPASQVLANVDTDVVVRESMAPAPQNRDSGSTTKLFATVSIYAGQATLTH
jgi:hypothetical protein